MIKENQQVLNRLNVLSDAVIIYLMIPRSFWLRYMVLPGGTINMSLQSYLLQGLLYTLVQIVIFLAAGLYRPFRHVRLRRELAELFVSCLLGFVLLLSWLSLQHMDDYSRQMIFIFFVLCVGTLGLKRFLLRQFLWRFRAKGYNLKHVVIIGTGRMARRYLKKIETEATMGYHALGYIAEEENPLLGIPRLGGFEDLEAVLEERKPDEVISAIEPAEFDRTPGIIADYEKTGCSLAIRIPGIARKPEFHFRETDIHHFFGGASFCRYMATILI